MNVKLVLAKGHARGHTIQVREPRSIVGRQRDCQVRIPSGDVSRRHCALTFEDGYLYVEDLGSTNGTFINGERVTGREIIQPGDLLEVGPVTFAVKYDAPQRATDELGVIPVLDDVTEVDVSEHPTKLGIPAQHDDGIEVVEEVDDIEVVEEVEEVEEIHDVEVVEEVREEPANADFNMDDQALNLPQDRDFRDLLSGLDGK